MVQSMRVTVRLFAMLREKAGTSQFNIELPKTATVADLSRLVEERFSGVLSSAPFAMVAVNAEYVTEDHFLHDNDEVAFIPPVSGGCGNP